MLIHTIARTPLRQKGAVLIIGLIFLVVITLLGVTAMQRTTLDTKIVGNYKSYRTAFEGAEAAVTEGECRLIPTDNNFVRPRVGAGGTLSIDNPKIWRKDSPDTSCTGNAGPQWWFSCGADWWLARFSDDQVYPLNVPFYGLEDNSTVASRPLFLFEYEGAKPHTLNVDDPRQPRDFQRITGPSSTGPNSQSNVMIQSIFAWLYRN